MYSMIHHNQVHRKTPVKQCNKLSAITATLELDIKMCVLNM